MDRRKFLKTTAAGGAVITIGVAPQGCGNPVTPAPLAKVTTQQRHRHPAEIRRSGPVRQRARPRQPLRHDPALARVLPAARRGRRRDHARARPRDHARRTIAATASPSTTRSSRPSERGQTRHGFLAVQSSCPHAACPLGYNSGRKLIECPCHASRFYTDPTDETSASAASSTRRRSRRSSAGRRRSCSRRRRHDRSSSISRPVAAVRVPDPAGARRQQHADAHVRASFRS